MIKVKKLTEEQEIWDKEEEAAKSVKKIVLECFHK